MYLSCQERLYHKNPGSKRHATLNTPHGAKSVRTLGSNRLAPVTWSLPAQEPIPRKQQTTDRAAAGTTIRLRSGTREERDSARLEWSIPSRGFPPKKSFAHKERTPGDIEGRSRSNNIPRLFHPLGGSASVGEYAVSSDALRPRLSASVPLDKRPIPSEDLHPVKQGHFTLVYLYTTARANVLHEIWENVTLHRIGHHGRRRHSIFVRKTPRKGPFRGIVDFKYNNPAPTVGTGSTYS